MFITVQFPLVDYRGLRDASLKLEKPKWPEPDPEQSKILYFGKIFNSKSRYSGPWDGEKRYCDTKKVINFCGRGDNHFYNSLFLPLESRILFKRFQSDGKFMVKFEVGFDDNFEVTVQNEKDPEQLKRLIYEHLNKYLLCPVKIKKGSRKFKEKKDRYTDFVPLIHSGDRLASSYYWASYKKGDKRTFNENGRDDYVEECEPVVIAQMNTSKLSLSGLGLQSVDISDMGNPNLELYLDFVHHTHNNNHYYTKSWLVGAHQSNATMPVARFQFRHYDETLRNLRINLIRLHSEVVVLKKILDRIGQAKPGDLNSSAAKTRVVYSLHKIFLNLSKYRRNSLPQQNLVQAAIRLEETVDENDYIENQLKGLEAVMEDLKKLANQQIINYTNQYNNYMGDQISIGTITGNFVNKSHLVDSLNTATTNGMSSEFKQELIAIAKKIEDSQNEIAAVTLNKINEEFAKPEQNKSRIKKFWDDLVKLMPDVVTIGKTVASVIALF